MIDNHINRQKSEISDDVIIPNDVVCNATCTTSNVATNAEPMKKTGIPKRALILYGLYIVLLILAFLIPYFVFSSSRTVSSKISISVSEVENISALQVLSVTDTQVVTENPEDNNEGITAWTQFTGRGDFIVNLQQSEIIVDNVRKTVIVRTPNVSINQNTFTIEYGNTETYFFHNSFGNDSYREGVDIAQAQVQEAYSKIYNSITRNQYYYSAAEESAERIITALVKSWNKSIPDLNVYVEIGVI